MFGLSLVVLLAALLAKLLVSHSWYLVLRHSCGHFSSVEAYLR